MTVDLAKLGLLISEINADGQTLDGLIEETERRLSKLRGLRRAIGGDRKPRVSRKPRARKVAEAQPLGSFA